MTIATFLSRVNAYVLNPIIILAFAVATVYFMYGIVKFLSSGTDGVDKSRQEAKDAILYGIIGMVVMFSVYGLIRFVVSTFGIDNTTTINGVNVNSTDYLNKANPR